MTTRALSGFSSSGMKIRPAAATTPRFWRAPEEILMPCSRSVSLGPRRFAPHVLNAIQSLMVCDCARVSFKFGME